MKALTFNGTVRSGKIELDPTVTLPEGSQVSIIVPTILDEQTARRKANGWLIEEIGNMVVAQNGRFIQGEQAVFWQFEAFVTSLAHPPLGPIGHVKLNAYDGRIMNDFASIEAMVHVGQQLTRSS